MNLSVDASMRHPSDFQARHGDVEEVLYVGFRVTPNQETDRKMVLRRQFIDVR